MNLNILALNINKKYFSPITKPLTQLGFDDVKNGVHYTYTFM